MTTERFTLAYEKIGKYFSMGIVDHETKEPFDEAIYEFHPSSFKDSKDEMEDLCLLLNELDEENKKLVEDYHQVMVQKELLKYKLEKFDKVMQKYEIKSVEKLDKILMEQRVW